MSITWRMEVKDETFTNLRDHPSVGQNYITPNAGVASLDSFSVDSIGNCLEAQFSASPKYVDIRPRDIVTLEISTDGGSSWTKAYRGYVVTAGNKRSKNIEQYKLVGLKQRFYEIKNAMDYVVNDDVADQAGYVFGRINTDGDWPAGVTASVPSIPTQNFANGVRYPLKESYGDTLQALADSVGRFVVPSGSTYTYDGVTYAAGETVLGTKWGVDGAGNAVFRRPQGANVAVAESSDNVIARYNQVTGEEIFDVVELIYATEIDNEPFGEGLYIDTDGIVRGFLRTEYAVNIPLTRSFTFGSNEARRQVVVPSPLAFMTSDMTSSSADGSVVNSSGAISGGTTEIGPTGTTGLVSYTSSLASYTDGFIARFTIQATSSSAAELRLRFGLVSPLAIVNEYPCLLYVSSNVAADIGTSKQTLTFRVLPVANLLQSSGFPGVRNSPFNVIYSRISFEGKYLEIEDVELYFPDVDLSGTASEQFASGFVRDTFTDVAQVQVFGEYGAVSAQMDFTPVGESQLTVPVERIEYSLTTREGLVTTYELGQAYDAELLSERAVLKSLAREAVSQ